MFAEEREPDTPEEEGVPGEPGESAPEEEAAPPQDAGAPGPEIEGVEALSAAAEGEEPAAEGEPEEAASAEGEEAASADGEQPAAEGEQPAPEGEEQSAQRERRPRRERSKDQPEEEVIPGMHLEPDLVLEEQREEGEYGQYADAEAAYVDDEGGDEAGDETATEPEPVAHTPLDLAADARYNATGKRKSAVARVILKPGEGTFSVNGRHLDEYFPRVKLQRVARQPLEAAGYNTRLDVVARIHGGGVAAQATALRHGIARALVEADPALRTELKRRGYLTRDPRVKERKKAGLKKARKRPQFSKR
jgi:small subunit ribosomal protein S9